ncbi:MAG: hypothetical protein ABWY06_09870 [Pseudomonas sp.]|uniref:hypothetical protein n=1 Tax=Pseudomonas sp. TaxID=306 RepID=UPI00339A4281
MSLQLLWSLWLSSPGPLANGLALFFALAGSWLLLATRWREQRALPALALEDQAGATAPALACEPAVQRINRFFKGFGATCLALALGLTWLSTQL